MEDLNAQGSTPAGENGNDGMPPPDLPVELLQCQRQDDASVSFVSPAL